MHRRACAGKLAVAAVVAVGLLLTYDEAAAGGFELPGVGARGVGRGGAYVVDPEDISAIHYNPGALAKQRGTTVTWNQGLIFNHNRFSRASVGTGLPDPEAAWGADAGTTFETVDSDAKVFPLAIVGGVTTDFGLENWTFAAGVFGPNGVGRLDYPDYGPQSFMLTDLDVLLAYYTVGAAWKLRDVFGMGATIQYVDLIQLKYGLVADSRVTPTLDPLPDEASTQLVTELDLADRTAATAQIGLWYRPHRRVELGLSSRIVPIYLEPKGGVNVDKPELVTEEVSVTMPLTLPAILRGGVRYVHEVDDREWFDLELDVVWENWSSIRSYDLDFEGVINGQPVQDLSIAKNWKDTVSIRLGGDVTPLPPYLTLRAGGFFETAAVDDNFSHLDFPSFTRGGLGAGVSAGAKGVYFTLGYMHVFQEDREITERTGKMFQQRPLRPCPDGCDGASGVPANAGKFQTAYDLLTFGLDIRFSELLAGRRERKKARSQPEPEPAASSAPSQATTAEPVAAEPEPTSEPETAPLAPESTEPVPAPSDADSAGPDEPDAPVEPPQPNPATGDDDTT